MAEEQALYGGDVNYTNMNDSILKGYSQNVYNKPGPDYGAPVGSSIASQGGMTFAGYGGNNSYVTSGQYAKDTAAAAAAKDWRANNLPSTGSTGARTSGGGGGSASYSVGYRGPTMDMPTFKAPEDYKSPDYKPPEYDEGLEKKLRQQYMAPGMSQVRRSQQQATISAKSIDNPNARALFINQAMEGAGAAISQVAGTATRGAQQEARARYSDELSKYNKTWEIAASDSKLAWDKEWETAMQEYTVGLGLFSKMPLPDQISAYNKETGTGSKGSSLGWSFKGY